VFVLLATAKRGDLNAALPFEVDGPGLAGVASETVLATSRQNQFTSLTRQDKTRQDKTRQKERKENTTM
jgi:hypothetical protein